MKNRKQPFGYRIAAGKIELCPREAEVVAEIFRRFVEGESYQSLTQSLNEQSVPYDEARAWNINMVARILGDERYTGCKGYAAIVSREMFDRAGEKRRRNARSCKLTEGQKVLQRLSGRRLTKSEEQQVRNLMLRLILHPDLVQPFQSESADRTEAIQIRNELERLLCEQPLPEDDAKAMTFRLAEAQYALLSDSEYETERIRNLLLHASTDQALDPILLKETVSSVRVGCGGEITIELKNHQIID